MFIASFTDVIFPSDIVNVPLPAIATFEVLCTVPPVIVTVPP